MKKNEPISKVMTTEVACIQHGQNLSDVRNLMCEANIHHVPIVQGKKLVRVVTFTDLMKINMVISGADDRTISSIIDNQFTINDIMTANVTTVKASDTIRLACEILASHAFHSLPVIDDHNDIVGIVTSTDLIRYLLNQY